VWFYRGFRADKRGVFMVWQMLVVQVHKMYVI